VIEPQGAVVAHVVADQIHESLQPLRLHHEGILRRNAPALSFQSERIGRRADFRAHAVAVLIHPRLGSGRIGTHCIVAIQADGHTEITCQGLGADELIVRQPL
jgi:hypothetical protein